MISIEEYRKILNDHKTSNEVVKKRIEYIDVFCRNIAKNEIKKYKIEQLRNMGRQ